MSHIDVDALLKPISDENPTGAELSIYEGSLLEISDALDKAKDLLKEERDREAAGGIDSQGQPWRTIPNPEWQPIIERCCDVLELESKDFRVASWLTDCLMREYGFFGLMQGLALCERMLVDYWESIRPAPNEDGHGDTVSAFGQFAMDGNGLDGAVIARGTKENARTETVYTMLDYARSKELEKVSSEERERRIEQEDHVDLQEIHTLVNLTPSDFHHSNLAAIKSSLEKLDVISEFLNQNCRPDNYDEPTSPTTSRLKEALETAREVVRGFVGEESSEESENEISGEPGESSAPKASSGGMTRESAFREIENIASFFEKTEPHSPVHSALRQVVRWGRTPLPKLLDELIDDSSVMERVQKLLGLPDQEYESEDS